MVRAMKPLLICSALAGVTPLGCGDSMLDSGASDADEMDTQAATLEDNYVCFYEHVNYGGSKFCRTAPWKANVPSGWNDRLSSIKIVGESHVELWQSYDYRGNGLAVDANIQSLVQRGYNDVTSSIAISRDDGASGGGGAADTPDAGGDAGGCGNGLAPCGGDCVDLMNNPDNCNACGKACDANATCRAGTCVNTAGGNAPPLAALSSSGKLTYGKYANQGQSNRDNILPDFSFAGYEHGGVSIPDDVPIARTVQPGDGDDRARIQAAINEVATLSPNANGFRGTVLLKKGKYEVGDPIRIVTDGIVLRGEGQGADGTVITATAKKQYNAIEIFGSGGGFGACWVSTKTCSAFGHRSQNALQLAGSLS